MQFFFPKKDEFKCLCLNSRQRAPGIEQLPREGELDFLRNEALVGYPVPVEYLIPSCQPWKHTG